VLSLDVQGPGAVTAGDLTGDAQIEIMEPDLHIATLNEGGHLKMQAQVKRGRGYVSADRNFDDAMGIGWIPVDSAHSPVRRVNYKVAAARLGQTTDYERLNLEVWTNGTVSPEESLALAAMLLKDHLGIFIHLDESIREEETDSMSEELSGLEALLTKRIDELDLSVRSVNSLKNANVLTLRDLVRKSEKDMLETKNFGKKSLEEVQEVLDKLGLSLGMKVPERPAATSGI
jgi:DNA-directed RNA polymerase subunit alpha